MNRSLTAELYNKRNINVAILCKAHETYELNQLIRDKSFQIDGLTVTSLRSSKIVFNNTNAVYFVRPQRAQIDLREISISLLLFSSSIEYNVRVEITRDLRPQIIYGLGMVGILQV